MASKEFIIRLLNRFLRGSATDKEGMIIKKWYSGLGSDLSPGLDRAQIQDIHEADREIIKARIRRKNNIKIFLWPSMAAASLLVFMVFYYSPFSQVALRQSNAVVDKRLVLKPQDYHRNYSASQEELWLTDSSRIILSPGSMISVATSFNQMERNVVLEGEALFDIRWNRSKPFKVTTYGIVTKVLGTSFIINAPSKEREITVVVKTGRVSVSNTKRGENQKSSVLNDEVVLTPNQQVIFHPKKNELAPSLVEHPVPIKQQTDEVDEYDEAPVVDILQDLESLFGITIQYDSEALMGCKMTTYFTTQDLYQRLDIIAKANGARYYAEGLSVRFEGKGCKR